MSAFFRYNLFVCSALLVGSLTVGCSSKPVVAEDSKEGKVLRGQTYPYTKEVDGKKLTLNNAGVAKFNYLGFPIEINVTGLYLETPSSDPKFIVESKQTKHFVFKVLEHDFPEDETIESWKRLLRKACVEDCKNTAPFDEIAETIGGHQRLVGSWEFTLSPDGQSLLVRSNSSGKQKTIKNPSIGKNILAIWYGPHSEPFNKEVGQQLLQTK